MNKVFQYCLPLIFGIAIFAVIRLVTDLPKNESLIEDSRIFYHILAQIFTITLCYSFDFICRHFFKKRKVITEDIWLILKEYLFVCIVITVCINLFMYIGESVGIFFMGNGIADYVIVTITIVLFLLIYYTIIRSDELFKFRSEQSLQFERIKNEQLNTELKFLKAQYHPHFLFNALNTVYFQVNEENETAKNTIELLSGLLRYQLYDIQQKVTLQQEIDYLNNYIKFQQLRMNDNLKLNYNFDIYNSSVKIHPLVFQPLVENAFKHLGKEYWINISLYEDGNKIILTSENAIQGESSQQIKTTKGIGIENLKRRLELVYPDKHSLITEKKTDSWKAQLVIELD